MSEKERGEIVGQLAQEMEALLQRKSARLTLYRAFIMIILAAGGAVAMDIHSMIRSQLSLPKKVSEQGETLKQHGESLADHGRKLTELHDFQTVTTEKLRKL